MKYLISDWNQKIQNSLDQIQKAKERISNLGEEEYKTIQESGAARLQAKEDLNEAEGAGWWAGTVVRKEIINYLKYYRKDLTTEDFVKICQIYNDSLSLPLLSGIEMQESEAGFEPFLEEWSAWRKEREEKGLEKILEIEKTPELPKRKEKKLRSKTFKTYEAAEKWSQRNHGGVIMESTMGGYWVEYYLEDTDAPETLIMCLGCDKKLHKNEMKIYKKDTFYCPECSKLFESGLSRCEVRKFQDQKRKEEIIEEKIEEPKEELKEASRVEEIEEIKEMEEEEKKEDKKEKNKKLSKTAKAKIRREKRKIRKIQEKEKDLRKLEREEKRLMKEQEKIEKKLEKVRKAKLALLAKLKKGPEGSEGGETGGNEGKREEEGEKEESKGFSKTSRIKEAKEQIKEEDKEEWKKAKSKIAARRRALTEQGFKRVLRDIANSKGEPKKVKSAIKKSKRYLERIEIFEDLIKSTEKFASWAPAWFINKSKVISKIKTLVIEWLEKNQDKEEPKKEEKGTPKAKVKGGSEGSEGGENREGGETEGRGGEEGDKEEPKGEIKEASDIEEIEEIKEMEEKEKKEDKEEEKETPKEEPKGEIKEASDIEEIEEIKEESEESKKPTKKEWREFKKKVGIRRRYISCSSEIGWIAGRADYKTKNIKGDLIENYRNLKKGLELIEKFENLLNSSKKFGSWAPRWFKGQAPMVWKIQRFINRWLEENRQTLIVKFAYREDIPEEYKEEAEKYRKEQEYWRERSKKYWIKRMAEVKAKREKEIEEREKE